MVAAAVGVVTLPHLRQPCLAAVEVAVHRALTACIRHLTLVPLSLIALPLLAHLERLAQALAAATVAKVETARLAVT